VRVVWTRWATYALTDAAGYIAEDSPSAARTFMAHVKKSVSQLSKFPNSGRPGRIEGTRELIAGKHPCIIAYRARHQRVEIVIHTARLWPESFPDC
jgi:toxin ParE1/3/4